MGDEAKHILKLAAGSLSCWYCARTPPLVLSGQAPEPKKVGQKVVVVLDRLYQGLYTSGEFEPSALTDSPPLTE